MLSGFYVKPLFCLSVLSTLAAQIISVKLSRTFLTYLCVVSTSLVSCILLIEHFRNQENYPSEVLMFIKAFGPLTMGLWVAGNVLIARKLAGCVPEKAGYSSVLAHNMYTTLLANVQFLLALSVYLFGLDLFSDMARKISSRLWQKLPSIGVMLSGVIPILLLVVSHVKTRVWQRRSIGSGHQSLQSLNAITMFWLFLISQSFCLLTMRGHGSWAEIGASLAYTLIVPTFCLLAGLLFLTL
nr:unnamed protein product [Spirometra erinaceieuropaei]